MFCNFCQVCGSQSVRASRLCFGVTASYLTCDKCWHVPPPHLLVLLSIPPLLVTAHSQRGFGSVVTGLHGGLAIKFGQISVCALCCFSRTTGGRFSIKTPVYLMSQQNPKYVCCRVLSVVVPYNYAKMLF